MKKFIPILFLALLTLVSNIGNAQTNRFGYIKANGGDIYDLTTSNITARTSITLNGSNITSWTSIGGGVWTGDQNAAGYALTNGNLIKLGYIDTSTRYLYGDWIVGTNITVMGKLTADTIISRIVSNATLNVTNELTMTTQTRQSLFGLDEVTGVLSITNSGAIDFTGTSINITNGFASQGWATSLVGGATNGAAYLANTQTFSGANTFTGGMFITNAASGTNFSLTVRGSGNVGLRLGGSATVGMIWPGDINPGANNYAVQMFSGYTRIGAATASSLQVGGADKVTANAGRVDISVPLNMSAQLITNVANAVSLQDAVTFTQLQGATNGAAFLANAQTFTATNIFIGSATFTNATTGTNFSLTARGNGLGGIRLGSVSDVIGAIWPATVNPGAANYSLGLQSGHTYVNSDTYVSLQASSSTRLIVGSGVNVGGSIVPFTTLSVIAAPTATANYGQVSIGNNQALFGGGVTNFQGSANGTYLAINSTSNYTGSIADFQYGGASKFLADSNGVSISSLNMKGTAITNAASLAVTGVAAASANSGTVSIGAGGFIGGATNFVGSAQGTLLAINSMSNAVITSAPSLLDVQYGGASKLLVTATNVVVRGIGGGGFTFGDNGDPYAGKMWANSANNPPTTSNYILDGQFNNGMIALNTPNNLYFNVLNVGKVRVTANGMLVGTSAILNGSPSPCALQVVSTNSATANMGMVSIGQTYFTNAAVAGLFNGSVNGTLLAVNSSNAFTGNMLDVQHNGTSRMAVSSNGVTFANGGTFHSGAIGSTPLVFGGTTPAAGEYRIMRIAQGTVTNLAILNYNGTAWATNTIFTYNPTGI